MPQAGIASTAGGDDFTSTIEASLAEDGSVTAGRRLRRRRTAPGAALDDDRINLMQWTLEQQKIDAANAERDLAEARSQLVVVQPGPVPAEQDGVNVALYAKQSTNAVGQSVYPRSAGARVAGVGKLRPVPRRRRGAAGVPGRAAGRSATATASTRTATAFACSFDPAPYRALN